MKALEVWTKFLADTTDYIAKVGGMEKLTDSFGNTLEKHSRKFSRAGLFLAGGFAAAVKASGDFESSMYNMQSVAGATTEELDQLRNLALKIGKETPTSAKNAADAMYWLASAGQSATEMMSTLPGVTTLATATQDDLSHSTEVVISTLKSFQYPATQTNRVVNVLAATIGASMANMDKLGESMKYVGPIAAQAGLSIEELASVLGNLYDLGLEGSMAGTAMKSVMSGLLDPSDKFLAFLRKSGMAISDVDPRLHDLADIFDMLKEKGFDVKDAMVSFGLRGAAATAFLASVGGDALRDLEEKVSDTDRAYQMAADQSQSFNNQIKMLWNNITVLGIQMGETSLPVLKSWVKNIKGAVIWLQAASYGTKKFRMETLLMSAGLLIFLGQLGKLSWLLKGMTGYIGGIAILFTAMSAAQSYLTNKLIDYNIALKDASAEEMRNIVIKKSWVAAALSGLQSLANPANYAYKYAQNMAMMGTTTKEEMEDIRRRAKEEAERLWQMHQEMEAMQDEVKIYMEEVNDQVEKGIDKLPAWQQMMVDFVKTVPEDKMTMQMKLDFIQGEGEDPIETFAVKVKSTVPDAISAIGEEAAKLPDMFSNPVTNTLGWFNKLKNGVYNSLFQAFVKYPEQTAEHFLSVVDSISQEVADGQKSMGEALLEISAAFFKETLQMLVREKAQELLADKITNIGSAMMQGVWDLKSLAMIPLILAAYGTAMAGLKSIKFHTGGTYTRPGEAVTAVKTGESFLSENLTRRLDKFLSTFGEVKEFMSTPSMNNGFVSALQTAGVGGDIIVNVQTGDIKSDVDVNSLTDQIAWKVRQTLQRRAV